MQVTITHKKKSGSNQVIYSFSYVDSVTGKRISRQCRGCSTRQEAAVFARKVMENMEERFTVGAICRDMFVPGKNHLERLESFGRNLDKLTIIQKRQMLDVIVRDFGARDIRTLKTSEIEMQLLKDRRHSGSWKNNYLDTFGSIYEETTWVCPYPVSRPKFMRFARNSVPTDTLTTEELELLLRKENWTSDREFLFFFVTASCGLRLGEARGLKVSQFLFDRKILVIDGFCKPDGERTNYNKKGSVSDRKIRVVPLADKTVKLVREYIRKQRKGSDDFLFTSEHGNPMRPQHFDAEFKRVIRKLKFDSSGRKLVPHSLRFTYVTRMRRNVDAETVRLLAGHTAVEMTDYYTRFGMEELLSSAAVARNAANSLFEEL